MKRFSHVAALMVVNAYLCLLLGLVLLALDPAVDWTLGFLGVMLFFCYATGPVFRLVSRPNRDRAGQVEAPTMRLPRVRFTVRWLMDAIVAVACLFSLLRAFGPLALVLVVAGLPMALVWWASAHRRPRRAARGFALAAAATNGLVAAPCVYFLNLFGLAAMTVAASLGIPAVLGLGAAWASGATGPDAAPRRRAFPARYWVLTLAGLPLTMFHDPWPLRLAFLASRPSLERLADRVASGRGPRRPVWAGPYRVVGCAVEPSSGNVGLIINHVPGGRSGFVRAGPGSPPGQHAGPFYNLNFDVALGGRWWYQDED